MFLLGSGCLGGTVSLAVEGVTSYLYGSGIRHHGDKSGAGVAESGATLAAPRAAGGSVGASRQTLSPEICC